MSARGCKLFLSVTALVEASTGLCLLILPAALFAVLLGLDSATADAIFVGRLAGAALLAIGVASWIARVDERTSAHRGLLTGILGIVSVVGSFFVSALNVAIIVTSILTTVWVLLVGYRLCRLGWQ